MITNWIIRLSEMCIVRMLGWIFVAANIGLFIYFWGDKPFGLTGDSLSYLETADVYLKQGGFFIEPSRTPGYPILNWVIAILTGVENIQELIPAIAAFQAVGYFALFAVLMFVFWRIAGLLGVIIVACLFTADHYNILWLKSIQSEAPSRLALIAAVAALAASVGKQSFSWLVAALFLIGITPLFRPSDVIFPLGALLGLSVYIYNRKIEFLRSSIAIALLISPFGLLIGFNGIVHGIYSPDTRSAPIFAARALALAAPERLLSAGIDKRIVEMVARPLHEAYLANGPEIIMVPNDFVQNDGVVLTRCPMDRRGVPEQLYLAVPDLFKGLDSYATSAVLQSIGRKAFFADPIGYLNCTKNGIWDFARLPLERPLKDKSLRNKLLIVPYLLPFMVGLICLSAWKSTPHSARAIVAACFTAAIAYWVLLGLLNSYVVRLGLHPWLPIALASALAWLLILRRQLGADR